MKLRKVGVNFTFPPLSKPWRRHECSNLSSGFVSRLAATCLYMFYIHEHSVNRMHELLGRPTIAEVCHRKDPRVRVRVRVRTFARATEIMNVYSNCPC